MQTADDHPFEAGLPDLQDVITGELSQRGEWVVANVETTSFWPVKVQQVPFRKQMVWILPITKQHFPALAMKVPPGMGRKECERLLMRFLSTLAWVEDKGFLVDSIGGGSMPVPMGRPRRHGFGICEEFDLSYFPEPSDEKALLALALMREGRGLNHPGYAFLSFYRVLEVALPEGRRRGEWINDHLDTLSDRKEREAISELNAEGVRDVGAHL